MKSIQAEIVPKQSYSRSISLSLSLSLSQKEKRQTTYKKMGEPSLTSRLR